MRHWVAVVAAEQFATERLYAREQLVAPIGSGDAGAVSEGDPVALVAAGGPPQRPGETGTPSVLFGHGIVRGKDADSISVEYRGRIFDEPPPVADDILPAGGPGLFPLAPTQFTRLAALVSASAEAVAGRSGWFVSVALPIEAATRADAVREFWTYLDKLGPRELPAYVWPLGDELAMQAFVLGAVTNLDPEEDGEED